MSLLRIGDLARLGGVSVRMLRHYHEVGLLIPEHIDEATGYRSYDAGQLDVLRRIVTLKNFGIPLAQVAELLREQPSAEHVQAILMQRRADLVAEIANAQTSLDHIDRHLDDLRQETPMTGATTPTAGPIDVELKPVSSRLVAQLSAVAESWAPEHIGPVIQPLYPELIARMERAGVAITGPSTAWYEDTDEGRILVHATLTIGARPTADPETLGFEVTELPAIDLVASTIHTGTMDDCDTTYQALLEWIDEHGYRAQGYSREIDIECGPDKEWITELQLAVEA